MIWEITSWLFGYTENDPFCLKLTLSKMDTNNNYLSQSVVRVLIEFSYSRMI